MVAMVLRSYHLQVSWIPLLPPPFFSTPLAMDAPRRSPSMVSWKTPPPSAHNPSRPLVRASSAFDSPLIWAVRTCALYALVQLGICGSHNSSLPGFDTGDVQQPQWLQRLLGKNEVKEMKRTKNKWHTTTKGTLKRSYRVPTKVEGRRLLNSIASLLSEDDTFRDATSHKGCQIRRENAHAETVCCYNVRAMFDELPTPHLTIEITAFPSGPITTADYEKAEKIEKLLKRGHSI